MKKILVIFVILALLITITVPAFAAKKDVPPGQAKKLVQEQEENVEKVKAEKEVRKEEQKEKLNGAEKYDFFLSGDVMPIPPYGSGDIEGSDEMSKLIVNQPNGSPVANVTGVMKGLTPNTEYRVFVGNGYIPYNMLNINLIGEYTMNYYITDENGALYPHTLTITEQNEDGTFTGTGVGLIDGALEVITGILDEYSMMLHSDYVDAEGVLTGYFYDADIIIANDGTMAGVWEDSNTETGVVLSDGVVEVTPEAGNTGYPGYLNELLLPAFTFTTNEEGHASWHINLLCDMINCVDGTEEFSVWINTVVPNATVLISETVVLECNCEEEVVTEIE